MPRVSIVIPVRNRESLLGQTLDSVRNQTFEDWECIVVDDHSTDDSFEVAFNVRYLLDVLQVVKGQIVLKFGKELRPCMIQEKDDDQFIYIIMPLRI